MSRAEREVKMRRDYIEWYVISKRTIYLTILGIILIPTLIGIYWYLHSIPVLPTRTIIYAKTRLVYVSGNVTIRKANGDVVPATTGADLEADDTIQTLSDGTASLQYVDGSALRIRPDSTVIIRENKTILENPQQKEEEGTQKVRNQVVVGNVTVTTTGKDNVVDAADVHVNFTQGSQGTVGVDKDQKKTTVTMDHGTSQALTSQGESKTLTENSKTEFEGGKFVKQIPLLPRPKLKAPDNAAILPFEYKDIPEVTFAWIQNPDAASYNIQIATNNSFLKNSIVAEQNLKVPIFAFGFKSVDGNYVWRVQAVAKDGTPGVWSEENKIQIIVHPAPNGKIRIDPPQIKEITSGLYEVSGTTEPGVQLRINGKITPVDSNGKYTGAVESSSGVRGIRIEAQDSQGRKGQWPQK